MHEAVRVQRVGGSEEMLVMTGGGHRALATAKKWLNYKRSRMSTTSETERAGGAKRKGKRGAARRI